MKNATRKAISLSVLLLFVGAAPFMLPGCGGGGGGGGSAVSEDSGPPPLTTLGLNGASDSVAVLDAMGVTNDLLGAGGTTESGVNSLSVGRDDASLHTRFKRLLDRMAAEAQASQVRALGSGTGPVPCENAEGSGVTTVVWNGPAVIVDICDMRNVRMTIEMENCVLEGVSFDGVMEVSVPESVCFPDRMDIVYDGLLVDEASDIAVECTDFSMESWNLTWDEAGDEIMDMDLVLNGTLAGSIRGRVESVSYYEVMATLRVNNDESYYAMTLDGYIQTTCLDGWLEVTTQEEVFMPFDFSCPFAGAYSVRGSDGEAVVTFSDSGVHIDINGEPQFSGSCEEVPSCLDA